MFEEAKELLKQLIEDDEIFDLTAQIFKKSHESLVRAGFTKEEATAIIAGQGASVKTSIK